jgi:hypothetical protein
MPHCTTDLIGYGLQNYFSITEGGIWCDMGVPIENVKPSDSGQIVSSAYHGEKFHWHLWTGGYYENEKVESKCEECISSDIQKKNHKYLVIIIKK